jgi:hypothetical protein
MEVTYFHFLYFAFSTGVLTPTGSWEMMVEGSTFDQHFWLAVVFGEIWA